MRSWSNAHPEDNGKKTRCECVNCDRDQLWCVRKNQAQFARTYKLPLTGSMMWIVQLPAKHEKQWGRNELNRRSVCTVPSLLTDTGQNGATLALQLVLLSVGKIVTFEIFHWKQSPRPGRYKSTWMKPKFAWVQLQYDQIPKSHTVTHSV